MRWICEWCGYETERPDEIVQHEQVCDDLLSFTAIIEQREGWPMRWVPTETVTVTGDRL